VTRYTLYVLPETSDETLAMSEDLTQEQLGALLLRAGKKRYHRVVVA